MLIKKEYNNSKKNTYNIKFNDSSIFMSFSLSSLVDNLSERVLSDKCTDCKSCLDCMSVKDDELIFKCLKCNKNHIKDFHKNLINRFVNTYGFCDGNTNQFILLLRKAVDPFEYMNCWERFDEILLSNNIITNVLQMLTIDMLKSL